MNSKRCGWATTALKRKQLAYLQERVDTLLPARYSYSEKRPVRVEKAQAVVDKYLEELNMRSKKFQTELKSVKNQIDKDLLFAESAEEALRAVEKLEALCKKKGWAR